VYEEGRLKDRFKFEPTKMSMFASRFVETTTTLSNIISYVLTQRAVLKIEVLSILSYNSKSQISDVCFREFLVYSGNVVDAFLKFLYTSNTVVVFQLLYV
jgi:hypothetical protein